MGDTDKSEFVKSGRDRLEEALPHLPKTRTAGLTLKYEGTIVVDVLDGNEGVEAMEQVREWWKEQAHSVIRTMIDDQLSVVRRQTDDRIVTCILGHIAGLEQAVSHLETKVKEAEADRNAHMTKAAKIQADAEAREQNRHARLRGSLINFLLDRPVQVLPDQPNRDWTAIELATERTFAETCTYKQMYDVIEALVREGKLAIAYANGTIRITRVKL